MQRVAVGALVALLVALAVGHVQAAVPPIILDVADGKREATIAARPNIPVPLTLIYGAPKAEPFELLLSRFVSVQTSGAEAEVRFRVDGKETTPGKPHPVPSMGRVLPMDLTVQRMPAAGSYSASLVVLQPEKDALSFRLTLVLGPISRPALLEVSPRSLALSTPRGPGAIFGEATPSATFLLSEKTGVWPAREIRARLEEGSEGVDVTRHLSFTIDGAQANLATGHNVSAGGATLVTVATHGLPAGKHTATLRFVSPDAGDSDTARLALTMQVASSPWLAMAWLAAALVVSFLATKFVVMFRQRLDIARRIREAETPWLTSMDRALPVVWVLDVLAETKVLGARWWLSGHPVIDARLKQTTTLVGVLERAHHLKLDLKVQELPRLVRNRAAAVLAGILGRLEATTLSADRAAQLGKELDALTAWTAPSKLATAYRDHVVGPMTVLCSQVRPQEIKDDTGRAVVSDLLSRLKAKVNVLATPPAEAQAAAAAAAKDAVTARATQAAADAALAAAEAKALSADEDLTAVGPDHPAAATLAQAAAAAAQAVESARAARNAARSEAVRATDAAAAARVPLRLDEILAVEEVYAGLKLLWEFRNAGEFVELVELQRQNEPIETLFARADKAVWDRLRSQPFSINVERSSREDKSDPTQWEPLTFSLVPRAVPAGGAEPLPVATTYLFRRGLHYHWTFTPTPGGEPREFGGGSTQPSVVAYAGKDATALTARVRVEWQNASLSPGERSFEVAGTPQAVCKSPEMRVHKGFEAAEMISWGLAGVLAMISGLWFLYAKNPGFGQPQDYLGLFAWGVGVDQGKNLLQVVQSWSAPKT